MKLFWVSVVGLGLLWMSGFGQLDLEAGKVHTAALPFKRWIERKTPHFDIQVPEECISMADQVARMAENAHEALSVFFDYRLTNRFQLQIYPSFSTYVEGHTMSSLGGLPTQIPNSGATYYPGTQSGLYQKIRAEVAGQFLREMFFYNGIQKNYQNRLLLYLPEWYEQGLINYLGYGWSAEDEAIMRGYNPEKLSSIIMHPLKPAENPVVLKSIWRFIADKFGPSKIAELVYMTRLMRSVDGGIEAVLGMTTRSFTLRWIEYCKTQFSVNQNISQSDWRKLRPGDQQDKLLSVSISPDRRWLAYWLENQKGDYKLMLYDRQEREQWYSGIKYQTHRESHAIHKPLLPIAWHPKSSELVTVISKGKQTHVYTYVVGARSRSMTGDWTTEVQGVHSLNYDPDGKRLVVSGYMGGQTDLFISTEGNTQLQRLTNDSYDDVDPVWIGAQVYFISNRGSELSVKRRELTSFLFPGNDIYTMPATGLAGVGSANCWRLTHTPESYKTGLSAANKNTGIVFSSDETGLVSLYYSNLPSAEKKEAVTNWVGGLITPTGNGVAMGSENGSKFLLVMDSLRTVENYPMKTAFGKQLFQERSEMLAKLTAKNDTDSLGGKPAVVDTLPETEEDSIKHKKARFYLFDDDESPNRRKNRFRKQLPLIMPVQLPFDIHKVSISKPELVTSTISVEALQAGFSFDPLFNLRMHLGFRLADAELRRRIVFGFMPYYDLRSNDVWLDYSWLPKEIDYKLAMQRSTRFFKEPQFIRYITYKVTGTASRPINRFLAIGVSGGVVQITRQDLRLTDAQNLDGNALLAGGTVFATFDNSTGAASFLEKGSRGRVSVEGWQYNGKMHYTTIQAEMRHYRSLGGKVILAVRAQAAASPGASYRQRFFLGGWDNWLNSKVENRNDLPILAAVPDFHFSQIIMPLRGFQYNARNGTQFMLLNAELRLPLQRLFLSHLPTKLSHSQQLLFFYDIGTAWRIGNPFSQRNPIDVRNYDRVPISATVQSLKSPFISGFGVGFRTVVLGYPTRFDLAWGIDDATVLPPVFAVSFGYDF